MNKVAKSTASFGLSRFLSNEIFPKRKLKVLPWLLQNNTDTGGAITVVWQCWNGLLRERGVFTQDYVSYPSWQILKHQAVYPSGLGDSCNIWNMISAWKVSWKCWKHILKWLNNAGKERCQIVSRCKCKKLLLLPLLLLICELIFLIIKCAPHYKTFWKVLT